MASKKRNALAELANELSWIETILGDEGYGPYCADANKAKRIIAALANVVNTSLIPQDCYGCGLLTKISVCRAIAEEGANNG